ncbi:MAG: GNAT family N-acetyltransferase [Acidobacteria bacterium]|nr:GNAT family N-acetyltransferase [Acidobacteriota bacterium]
MILYFKKRISYPNDSRHILLGTYPQILRATPADAPALSELSAVVFPLGCPANTPPQDLADYISREHTPARYLAMLQDDRFAILIAKVADNLAGLALLAQAPSPAAMQSSSALELRRFYIDSSYHGRGVANVLMEAVLALAAERGEPSLWLSAFSGNGRAIAFYKRWGFRIAGEHDFIVGTDRQRDYLMLHETSANSGNTSNAKEGS